MYYFSILLQEILLLSYVPNILYAVLQVAAKVLIYYAQCYKKLHFNGLVYYIIILLVLKDRALHKGPGL